MAQYNIGGLLGINFTQQYAAISTSTPEIPGLPFALGTRAHGTDGTEWLFVVSSGSITQYSCVCVDEDYTARMSTTTLAGQASHVGFAQSSFATDTYGWVAVNGASLECRVKDNVAANSQLYTSASAGVLGTDASTGNPLLVAGVRTVEAAASGGGATEVIATYPHFKGAAL